MSMVGLRNDKLFFLIAFLLMASSYAISGFRIGLSYSIPIKNQMNWPFVFTNRFSREKTGTQAI